MSAQLGTRHDVTMRNHARGHGVYDDLAPTAEAQTVSSGGRGPQTSMTGDDNPEEHDAVRRLENLVDETLKASFPASDPPSWTLGGSRREPDGPRTATA